MKKLFIICLAGVWAFCGFMPVYAGTEEDIAVLKTQVQTLLGRIETLEREQSQTKQEAVRAKEEAVKVKESSKAESEARVNLSNALSKLKLKGRWAAGYFDSGKAGSFPAGSFEIPEGKIQFSYQPDDINTIVMRFNVNNATANSPLMDYFYLQSKGFLPWLKDTPFSLDGRLGRFKLGFGEETWSNNLVESVLPSNSAANAGVSDEGLELAGKLKLDTIGLKPLGWVASVSDGNSGVGSDSGRAKAFMGKLYHSPIDPLYLSGTFYDSGNLKTSNAEMTVGGLATRPTGATNWRRKAWELDARYDFGKGKKSLDPPAYSDSKAILRLSYGAFHDITASAQERSGNFGFAEGMYNFTKKVYGAYRYSFMNLDSDTTVSINGVTANEQIRNSLGLGYRWSENTIIKFGYDWNMETGTNTENADNNLVSAVVASQF